jgi:sugar/nucleoside kinase (ribokinase family)
VESVDIIVSGHLCLDLHPRMDKVPLEALAMPGRLYEVDALNFSTGGAVSNTGLALHRLGVNVRLMAAVGDDIIGQMIIKLIQERDPALIEMISVQSGQPGSYTIALSPQRVDRIFLHCIGTNSTFGVDNIDFSLLTNAQIFHLGYPPYLPGLIANDGEELQAIYEQAKAVGVVTSMDTALPDPNSLAGRADWHKILRRTLPYIDIIVPSIEEIIFMLRRADFDTWRGSVPTHLTIQYLSNLADELLDMGAAIAGFKLGDMGMYLKTTNEERFRRLEKLPLKTTEWASCEVYAPAFKVEVVGTTGAGDSAYAGFLAALLHGMTPEAAARWANAVGACNVEAADATSGIRTWTATEARLNMGWPMSDNRLSGS